MTEKGVAALFGADQRDQAARLIDRAAHPRVRETLWAAARAHGLSTRGAP